MKFFLSKKIISYFKCSIVQPWTTTEKNIGLIGFTYTGHLHSNKDSELLVHTLYSEIRLKSSEIQ